MTSARTEAPPAARTQQAVPGRRVQQSVCERRAGLRQHQQQAMHHSPVQCHLPRPPAQHSACAVPQKHEKDSRLGR